MMPKTVPLSLALAALLFGAAADAADQTRPGAGNEDAAATAAASPRVQASMRFLLSQARRIRRQALREQTLDAVGNRETCLAHRAGLTTVDQDAIVQQLVAEGLIAPADGTSFPGGLRGGVFPPVLDDGSKCPRLPMPFEAAPGGAFPSSHHSYPGGLPIHEAFNDRSAVSLADNYRRNYSADSSEESGEEGEEGEATSAAGNADPAQPFFVDQDVILAAPLWHDWAKPIVFQWNADGSEFAELNFGGAGKVDNDGAPGDSRTGGHHIIGVAETMKRGLEPDFVIAQASAHSAPTLGNEYKVVNWLRAAAILARIDPIARGYLRKDAKGHYRLPALRRTGSIDLNAATPSQTNLLPEYTLHNLSDADFSFTIPAVTESQVVLARVAPDFGYDPADTARYNTRFRNVVFSRVSAERLLSLYSQGGIEAVSAAVAELRAQGAL